VKIGRHTLAMLRQAKEWWTRTGGAFDVTVAPVVAAWGFQPGGTPHLLAPGEIAAALRLVGVMGMTPEIDASIFIAPAKV
jgi:FAD:protein FMN transferase